MPESERKLYAVIGFQPPKKNNKATTSPVGDNASTMPAIPISEGFNLGYCKAKPGRGPLMHNHDTNETFIAMTGKWRCEWNEGKDKMHVDLNPFDVISFPPGMARRFMNVTKNEPDKEHLLMFVIGGNQPRAEFTPAAMARCAEFQQQMMAKAAARKPAPAKKKGIVKRVTSAKGPAKKAAVKKARA